MALWIALVIMTDCQRKHHKDQKNLDLAIPHVISTISAFITFWPWSLSFQPLSINFWVHNFILKDLRARESLKAILLVGNSFATWEKLRSTCLKTAPFNKGSRSFTFFNEKSVNPTFHIFTYSHNDTLPPLKTPLLNSMLDLQNWFSQNPSCDLISFFHIWEFPGIMLVS